MKPETLTLLLVNLAGIMERADESLLPGVYKEVGAALHTDPTGLGSLTFFCSVVKALCYPLAMCLSVRYNRTHVIALGAFLWALATFFAGISTTFLEVAISRGFNGVGLAIVTPAIQSLVADCTDANNRGVAFGWLQLTGNIGAILGGLVSILLAPTSFLGIAGWRISFHLVAIISIIVGILVPLFAKDPQYENRNSTNGDASPRKSLLSEFKELFLEAKSVIKLPTFQIIAAQGVIGSCPWSALSFAPMWLELIGFSHKQTAFLMGGFTFAGSVGGLFGGKMGDVLSVRLPNSGRIILSQISSGSAIPLAWILMLVLPEDPSTALRHGSVLFVMGFFISWNGAATNFPIFAEIVPEKSRTSIYALDRTFESILASFAPPIVGLLSQHAFGYKPIPEGSTHAVEAEMGKGNAASLGKALYASIAIPMMLCCLIYSFLYCTYPRDRDRARMKALALIEAEMVPSVPDHLLAEGEHSQVQDSEARRKETVIALDYGAEEGHDTNDNEKRTNNNDKDTPVENLEAQDPASFKLPTYRG